MVIKTLLPLSIIIFPLFAEAKDNLELSAEVEVSYGYESNVSVDDVDLNTNIGDQFIDLRFSSDLVFKIQESTEMSAGLTISDRLYDTFDEFDGLLSLASLAVSHQKGDWEYGLITRYIDYQLDGSELLAMTQISPSLAWFPSKRTYLYLNYERSRETYSENSQRSNDRDEVGAAFYYFINGLRQYITIQTDVAKEKAKAGFFSNDSWQIRLAFMQRMTILSRDSTLRLAYRHENRRYDRSINPTIADFRKDTRHRYEFGLEIPINEDWSAMTLVQYSDYRSNLKSSDYNQELYQLTVQYQF